ncbi:MAG: nicotinate-nucleotide adenylyltransferase [Planctomycetes bacterium]|nr:nicotinate-nucleotide adenylyltransferase [Planctomycetota bacterium]
MRIGIFGGTFDPVHYGHLLLAETSREQCSLDQVWLLPAAVPPHKQERVRTPAKQRMEMLELAIAGHEAFVVSPMEIERGGVSYTVDTLAAIRERQPDAEVFFLMGADSLRDLPTWRETGRICQLATPVVVRRRGAPEPDFNVLAGLVADERLEEIRRHQVEMPVVEFSSTAIRQATAAGRSTRYQTPRAVEKYIETHELYRES